MRFATIVTLIACGGSEPAPVPEGRQAAPQMFGGSATWEDSSYPLGGSDTTWTSGTPPTTTDDADTDTDIDADTDVDTDADTDTGGDTAGDAKTCGCATTGTPSLAGVVLLAGLAWRRRRRG